MQTVVPIVVMRQPAQGGFHATDDHGHLGPEAFEGLGVNGDGAVRTGTETAFRGIGIIVPQAFGGRIVVDHRVHCSRIDRKVQARPPQFAEIAQVVLPAGLGNDGDAVTELLQVARDAGGPEGGMVHEGVARYKYNVNILPAQRLYFFNRSGEHIIIHRCGRVMVKQAPPRLKERL